MAIAREQLIIGGKCYLRTRLSAAGGSAIAVKTTPVVVREVNRGAATVEYESGKRRMVPFGELEPDHEFLAEHMAKQTEKRERIRREAQPLTYKMEDVLERDEPPPSKASDETREKALRALEALKAPAEPAAPPPANNKPKLPKTEDERRAAVELWRSACNAGETPIAAAQALGIPRSTLYYWGQRLDRGMPLAVKMGCPGGAKPTHSKAQKRTAAEAFLRGEATQTVLANELGVSQSVVSSWVRDYQRGGMGPPEQTPPSAPPPPAPVPAAPPQEKESAENAVIASLRAENARLRGKVTALLSMIEKL